MSKDPSFDYVCNHRDALADENSVLKQQNAALAMAFNGVDPLFLRPGFVLSKVQEVDALHLLIARERQQRDGLLAALTEIANWVDKYTSAGHPVSTIARQAIANAGEA